jgi:hypothetical protein
MRYDLNVIVLLGGTDKIVTVEAETEERAIADWQTEHPNDIVIAWRETRDDAGHAPDAQ